MAKSDFDIEENNDSYENQISNKKNFFNNTIMNNPEIVYDENEDNSLLGKLKYYFSSINKSVLMFFGILAGSAILVIIIIVALISSYNKSFKTEITIPEVVYLGETATISAISEGSRKAENTVVTFNFETIVDEDDEKDEVPVVAPLELLTEEAKGKEIYNTLIPIQEGGVTITVKAKAGSRHMGTVKKDIYVCPRFDSNLVPNGIISVRQGDSLENQINFGPGTCSKKIKYKSGNTEIFTVDNSGKISGIKNGMSNLIITRGERSFSVPVQITNNEISMTTFDVSPKKIFMTPGENRRLNVSYLPIATTTQKVRITSDNYEIVRVGENGIITAIKPGIANIEVKAGALTDPKNIEVLVSKLKSNNGSFVTDIELDKKEINLTQGESSKINYLITPDDAKDKSVKYVSSDEDVAIVNSKGVIYAKNPGDITITVSTSNSILRTIRLKVKAIEQTKVLSDDGIIPNNWHNRKYKLKFSGGSYGATYYYGYAQDKVNKKSKEVFIENEGTRLIYTKACLYNLCGPTTTTLSKLDSVRPQILKIVTRKETGNKTSLYVAAYDATSMINSWCINKTNDYSDCNWISVSPIKNPVLNGSVDGFQDYYVFVRDSAGNISKSMKVNTNNDVE